MKNEYPKIAMRVVIHCGLNDAGRIFIEIGNIPGVKNIEFVEVR